MYLFITPPLDAKETSPRVIARRGGGDILEENWTSALLYKVVEGHFTDRKDFPPSPGCDRVPHPGPFTHTKKMYNIVHTLQFVC